MCGYITAPYQAGSPSNPVCFDSDRSSDPPNDYDRVTPDQSGLPSGFTERTVISGLNLPTVVRFSPDGRVFVAEKGGVIKVYDSLSDPTPSVFADLSAVAAAEIFARPLALSAAGRIVKLQAPARRSVDAKGIANTSGGRTSRG